MNVQVIAMFATNGGLSFLSSSNIWFMDGIFKYSSIFAEYSALEYENKTLCGRSIK